MEEKSFNFEVPKIEKPKSEGEDAQKYIPTDALISAVRVAMTLGQPLLITGEPGTGKTLLATAIAQHRGWTDDGDEVCKPLIFNTKTTSTAQDLFYTYDAVRHFQDANIKGAKQNPTSDYIELQALGKAIAMSNAEVLKDKGLVKGIKGKARPSVVLIDEIDKAPTDFPNDILYEIQRMSFFIKELDMRIERGKDISPFVVMTSNSEKNLPAAFLRRCVFYHIPFPKIPLLSKIVKSHMGDDSKYTHKNLIKHFMLVRDAVKKKKPATSELIGWLQILKTEKVLEGVDNLWDLSSAEQKEKLYHSYSVLAKDQVDLKELKAMSLDVVKP